MASSLLPASPTPERVAQSYADNILAPRAQLASGKDGRVGPAEAESDPFVADAYDNLGKARPNVASVVASGKAKMLAAAQKVGGDGRVSGEDATHMSALEAQAFAMLRAGTAGPATDGQKVANDLAKLAKGLLFPSESDYPFTPVFVKLAPDKQLDEATFNAAFDFAKDDTGSPVIYKTGAYRLELNAHDDVFTEHLESDDPDKKQWKALEKAFLQAVVSTAGMESTPVASGATPKYQLGQGKLWTVTPREEDSAFAPYYIVGRLPTGDLVGLKSYRVWT